MLMTTDPTPPNRRQSPRFDTLGRIVGHLPAVDLPVRIREIGFGGFSVETMEPLAAGGSHVVRFTARDDWSVELPARAVQCRPSCAPDGSPRFATGFAFEPHADSETAVKRMIETITSVRFFES
jgi:hypothetical protein